MSLFRCQVIGIQPTGRQWSFRQYYTSGSSTAAVEVDWLAQINSWWTNGAHGLETLFPAGTLVQTTKTALMAVVTIGTVDKLRETQLAIDNPALPGTSANAVLPEQNAIVISLRTSVPGREGRGRNHLPAPDETLVTNGEMDPVSTARVTTAFQALAAGMAAAGHTLVLATEVKPKTGTAVGTTKAVGGIETDRIIRTMRIRNKSRVAVYV